MIRRPAVQPWLMSTDPSLLAHFAAERDERRPDAVVVDWEHGGKQHRQAGAVELLGFDTTIRPDDDRAVARVRGLGFSRVVCRIDAVSAATPAQVAAVREQGGTDVLVPMWHSLDEIDTVVGLAHGLGVGAMVETTAAVETCGELAGRGVTFAFVGLMDLAIERRTPSIFAPLVDGTLDTIAARLDGLPFGFGGLTIPTAGSPIPNRLLLGELARLGAGFSMMRRSFLHDVAGMDPGDAIAAIRQAAAAAADRDARTVAGDRAALTATIEAMRHG